jgi:hypothetical protein
MNSTQAIKIVNPYVSEFEWMLQRHNVSQEATGDAARLASNGAGVGGGNSQPGGIPRRLSSRLLARR